MKLQSEDGAVVELVPVSYQFGPSSEPRDWDANWLEVAGRVRLRDGRAWSFEDPCLTTWESRRLTDWLRSVQSGDVAPVELGDDEERLLVFTEPNVAFSLASRAEGRVTLRVHLSLESGPPWEQQEMFDFFVPVTISVDALARAIGEWEGEVSTFPVR